MDRNATECVDTFCPGVFSAGRIFWCVVATVLAVLCYHCCSWRIKSCYQNRPTAARTVSDVEEGPPELETTVGESGSCTICLDEIGLLQRAVRLDCGHVFHAECLLPWMFRSKTCPNCRALADP